MRQALESAFAKKSKDHETLKEITFKFYSESASHQSKWSPQFLENLSQIKSIEEENERLNEQYADMNPEQVHEGIQLQIAESLETLLDKKYLAEGSTLQSQSTPRNARNTSV